MDWFLIACAVLMVAVPPILFFVSEPSDVVDDFPFDDECGRFLDELR